MFLVIKALHHICQFVESFSLATSHDLKSIGTKPQSVRCIVTILDISTVLINGASWVCVCVCGVFCILMNKERDHGQGLLPVMKQQIKNSTKGVCTVSVPLFQRVMHVMSSQKRPGGFDRAPGMEWRGRWNFVGA